jgi:hypothetical protein
VLLNFSLENVTNTLTLNKVQRHRDMYLILNCHIGNQSTVWSALQERLPGCLSPRREKSKEELNAKVLHNTIFT